MLNVILRILSVLGVILLVLLAVLAVFLLLVLFFPLSYRIRGSRDEKGVRLSVKAGWLFGLLRLKYEYPESGHLVVKALCFPLYDSMIPEKNSSETERKPERKHRKRRGVKKNEGSGSSTASDELPAAGSEGKDSEISSGAEDDAVFKEASSVGENLEKDRHSADAASETPEDADAADADLRTDGKIFQKFEKIKYTIYGIYDKIKKIWKNISYYTALVQEEETKKLFAYILFRFGKIFKHIRPRRIKADILFGAGSPDVTGYIYGIYCMLASAAGIGFRVTPDFEHAVFKGRIDMSGHMALWVLGWNVLKLYLDKEIRRFRERVKIKA